MFIPYLLVHVSGLLVIFIYVPVICLCAHMFSSHVQISYEINTVLVIIMIYLWINSIIKLLIYPTIQKHNVCRQFLIQGFFNVFISRKSSLGAVVELSGHECSHQGSNSSAHIYTIWVSRIIFLSKNVSISRPLFNFGLLLEPNFLQLWMNE